MVNGSGGMRSRESGPAIHRLAQGEKDWPSKLTVISTYPPRPCGIGMFAADLHAAIRDADPNISVDVVSIVADGSTVRPTPPVVRAPRAAVGDGPALLDAAPAAPARIEGAPDHPAEVAATLRQHEVDDYVAVARAISASDTEVVLVEHEFGIFGGEAGDWVVNLVEHIRQPVVVTLHTVLSAPSPAQFRTLRDLCRRADLVTVFTETARRMVVGEGIVEADRVRVVPHGAPEILVGHSDEAAAVHPSSPRSGRQRGRTPQPTTDLTMRRLEGRTVLSTFGLISSGKGIEYAIQALPPVVQAHPDVLYLVAGQTHPEVVKHEGETYRQRLETLVDDLHLRDHVLFLDRFLTIEELADLLAGTDLYLTPYRSREQIVSGALTFAVAAGCPVISTPYFYAEDLLASGAGRLVPFADPVALGAAINTMLDSPADLARARGEARRIGSGLSWPSVGRATVDVLAEALHRVPRRRRGSNAAAPRSVEVRSDHLLTLIDDIGIIQHANGVTPRRSTGYCVDDVARMILVGLDLRGRLPQRLDRRMVSGGLAFLEHAWSPQATAMHNFMGYDRRWEDEPAPGDHFGRAVWALGEVVAAQPKTGEGRPSLRLLEAMEPAIGAATSLRTVAFAILGLAEPASDLLPDDLRTQLRRLSDHLAAHYDASADESWRWFESSLTYDNARLPQALIEAGRRLADDALLERGLAALNWYADLCDRPEGGLQLVGNRWRHRTEEATAGQDGDEQPLDAAALIEALVAAAAATGDTAYAERAERAFGWFFGKNRLGVAVYDAASGGCRDGLGERTVSDNEGAESTLAFWQAALALERAGRLALSVAES